MWFLISLFLIFNFNFVISCAYFLFKYKYFLCPKKWPVTCVYKLRGLHSSQFCLSFHPLSRPIISSFPSFLCSLSLNLLNLHPSWIGPILLDPQIKSRKKNVKICWTPWMYLCWATNDHSPKWPNAKAFSLSLWHWWPKAAEVLHEVFVPVQEIGELGYVEVFSVQSSSGLLPLGWEVEEQFCPWSQARGGLQWTRCSVCWGFRGFHCSRITSIFQDAKQVLEEVLVSGRCSEFHRCSSSYSPGQIDSYNWLLSLHLLCVSINWDFFFHMWCHSFFFLS